MATLDSDQLTDFRADIGDDGTVFTNAELHRLYTRAGSDYNKAIVLGLRQLMMNAAKLHDYRIAQSSESRSQIFKNLQTMLEYWEEKAETRQQVQIVGMAAVPVRDKDEPSS